MEQNGFISEFLAELTLAKTIAGFILGALMTALFRALIWVFGKSPQKEFAFWVVTFTGIVCVLIFSQAVFSPTIVLEAQPDLPDFSKSSIAMIIVGETTEMTDGNIPPGAAAVTLLINVVNTGKVPSEIAVGSYSASLTLPSGDSFIGKLSNLRGNLTLNRAGDQTLVIRPDQWIIPLTTTNPINRGAVVRGYVAFVFDNLGYRNAQVVGMEMQLTMSDVFGRSYVLRRRFDSVKLD